MKMIWLSEQKQGLYSILVLPAMLWFLCKASLGGKDGAVVEPSPPTNVTRVQIPASMPYVGWVCCWFSPLLWEAFPRELLFSTLLKNQHFQIPIPLGMVDEQSLCINYLVKYYKSLSIIWLINLFIYSLTFCSLESQRQFFQELVCTCSLIDGYESFSPFNL